ncbi:DUF6916 family protein [Dyella mobilis]|uniref:DUF6916 domain-containing protein n=1 Tax=Dyella mobilis TaxID=1849582 RepID=A0ABS2KDT1_9GAMM|nr:hypothetical protein [Dyella mobilis]MBM7128937.1 hypothetical protein [Dyella mobilis]GLQ99373.1 hypothetical protein GCM10007863_37930 [Dyella mobilis]
MQPVPTHAALTAALGQLFVLEAADGQRLEVRLAAAPSGVAMEEAYACYSATFELPMGAWLPQDTYRITAPDGSSWELLATPTRPSADGRANLTAVMHISVSPPGIT